LRVSSKQVIEWTAEQCGITVDNLTGKCKFIEYTIPRGIAMLLMRDELKMTLNMIGRNFNRAHSTVLSNLRHLENRWLIERPDWNNDLNHIRDRINEFRARKPESKTSLEG